MTPAGSCSRMNSVNIAVRWALSCCCSASVGRETSTMVEASMSILKYPAAIASLVSSRRASSSRSGVAGPVLGADLVVVALDEDRPLMPLLDRRRQRVAGVFARSLLGVGHLGAGQLEEHDLAVVGARGAVDGAHGVVGESTHVDGRSGAVGVFAAAGGHVEGMDRGGPGAQRGCGHANEPAGGVPLRSLGEDGGGDQAIDQPVSQSGGIEDLDSRPEPDLRPRRCGRCRRGPRASRRAT